jgi:hypothetical protein
VWHEAGAYRSARHCGWVPRNWANRPVRTRSARTTSSHCSARSNRTGAKTSSKWCRALCSCCKPLWRWTPASHPTDRFRRSCPAGSSLSTANHTAERDAGRLACSTVQGTGTGGTRHTHTGSRGIASARRTAVVSTARRTTVTTARRATVTTTRRAAVASARRSAVRRATTTRRRSCTRSRVGAARRRATTLLRRRHCSHTTHHTHRRRSAMRTTESARFTQSRAEQTGETY